MDLPKSFYIQTFGCQMNVADTEQMGALLQEAGLEEAKSADNSDLIIVNGCSVREKAVHKAVSSLGTFQSLKTSKNKRPLIGLGGCVGQLDGGKLMSRAPYLDFVFGPDAIPEIPEIVFEVARGDGDKKVFTEFDRERKYSTETKTLGEKRTAFVNIMKGCDKFCTYCIVPFTRGREKSRKIEEVCDDIDRLVSDKGVREVTLLGQNVNSFGKGNFVKSQGRDENFTDLLRALDSDERLDDLKRIRFTSSHPVDFSDELVECYALNGGVSKLAWQLHLPVQSGSSRVLKAMGRNHPIEKYIDQMRRLKKLNPHVGLSTDLIVGFPTETDSEFEETLQLMERLEYDSLFVFAYSPRPGTKAAKLDDDIPKDVKKSRLNRVLELQREISERKNHQLVGRQYEIMVEGKSRSQSISIDRLLGKRKLDLAAEIWTGRTSCNRLVHFACGPGRKIEGEFLDIKVTGATALALYGEVA